MRCNQAIKQTSEHNLSHRLPDPGSKDELGRLTHSFNGMLERLEESFQKQRRFSANVAHELKTPLATMKASAQVLELEETPTKEDYEETLQIMEHSTDRLIQVVDDLLLMNREEQEQNWEEVSLPEMFAGIVAEVKAAYPEKSCAVTLELKREHVMGNASLIYRAFFNLVENAWKYNQSNGQIYISSETESGVGKIIIQDTGIGIPEDQLDLIFEPFYRVDLSRSRKIAGAGLGLSLVEEILQKHHWNIQVESSLRKGDDLLHYDSSASGRIKTAGNFFSAISFFKICVIIIMKKSGGFSRFLCSIFFFHFRGGSGRENGRKAKATTVFWERRKEPC